jgi:hypothetical protein
MSGHAGAVAGAVIALAGVLGSASASHQQLNASTLQSGFEAVALGADVGFVLDATGVGVMPGPLGSATRAAVAGAADAIGQGVGMLGNPDQKFSTGEVGIALGGSLVADGIGKIVDDAIPAFTKAELRSQPLARAYNAENESFRLMWKNLGGFWASFFVGWQNGARQDSSPSESTSGFSPSGVALRSGRSLS